MTEQEQVKQQADTGQPEQAEQGHAGPPRREGPVVPAQPTEGELANEHMDQVAGGFIEVGVGI